MPNYKTEQIRYLNPITKIIAEYGFQTDKKGFMCCPFHSEKTASFKVYPESNSYYCFGCGAHGDVIDFVKQINNVSFEEACKQLGGEATFSQKRQIAKIKRETDARDDFCNKAIKDYWQAFDHLMIAETAIKELKPNSPEEEPNQWWLSALVRLAGLQYALECAEEVIYKNGF